MVEIINLNRERKARDKATAKRKAIENRTVFGRSRDEKTGARMRRDREALILDGSRLSDD